MFLGLNNTPNVYSQLVELAPLAAVLQSSAAAELASLRRLLHEAPRYDPLKLAESPVEAMIPPGVLHSLQAPLCVAPQLTGSLHRLAAVLGQFFVLQLEPENLHQRSAH
jgi:hypothetical protein